MCRWIFVLVHVIDALGGIDINVEEAENGMDIIPYLNNYVVEVIKNTRSGFSSVYAVRTAAFEWSTGNGSCPSQIRRR